jgi:uncharacterized membrane protein YtjA (UPF0391 family)
MKQAQSEKTRRRPASRWRPGEFMAPRNRRRTTAPALFRIRRSVHGGIWWLGQAFMALLAAVWLLVTLPFRLVFWIIAWLGRLTAMVLGFSLMVVGMALWASPLFFIGIPLFLVGLVLTLRCLD